MTNENGFAFINQWNQEVSELYDYALTEKGSKQAGLLTVTDALAARYLTECGMRVSGFCYILDAQGIRHIHKQHGNPVTETPRGQVAITKQDILDLRLAMTKPDTVGISVLSSHSGLTRIEATKVILGHILYCIMEVRTGRWRLVPVTVYKRKSRS